MSQGKLRKDAGLVGLLLAGVSTMIGSGWLFGPMHAAQNAGPLSIASWAIAATVVALIALVYAELAPMFPKSGGLVHMSLVSHGALVGRIWSWILFLAYVSIAPVEAMAVVTYANSYIPGLIHANTGLLTGTGFWVSVLVLGAMTALNFMVLRLVLLFNSVATWIKVCTPIATIIVLWVYSHHTSNLDVPMREPGQWARTFTSISTAGVFFSLFGFRQPIDLAGETRNPSRNLPIAVIGTIAVGAAIFILLQYAFVTSIPPATLAREGWEGLSFAGVSGPFAGLVVTIGASFWAIALYADAIISPSMCGYIWLTTTPRVLYAMGEERLWPRIFTRINRHGVPWIGVLATYFIGILFFFPFPSWQKLVGYASAATVVSYGLGPIVLLRLRHALPNTPNRSFKLWTPNLMASLAFIASNLVMFWAGYNVVTFMLALLAAVFVLYVAYFFGLKGGARQPELEDWKHALWLVPYFAGMWLLSYLGPTTMGGAGVLNIYWDMAAVAVLSLIILKLAVSVSLPDDRIVQYYGHILDESATDAVWETADREGIGLNAEL